MLFLFLMGVKMGMRKDIRNRMDLRVRLLDRMGIVKFVLARRWCRTRKVVARYAHFTVGVVFLLVVGMARWVVSSRQGTQHPLSIPPMAIIHQFIPILPLALGTVGMSAMSRLRRFCGFRCLRMGPQVAWGVVVEGTEGGVEGMEDVKLYQLVIRVNATVGREVDGVLLKWGRGIWRLGEDCEGCLVFLELNGRSVG